MSDDAIPKAGDLWMANILRRGCTTPFHEEECRDGYGWECEECPVMIERGITEKHREKAGYGTW